MHTQRAGDDRIDSHCRTRPYVAIQVDVPDRGADANQITETRDRQWSTADVTFAIRDDRTTMIDETSKLYALDAETSDSDEDTDSLPILPDAPARAARQATDEDPQPSLAASIDDLDWLISIATTLDKRVERIEEALHQIQCILAEKQDRKGMLGQAFASFWSLLQRRSK